MNKVRVKHKCPMLTAAKHLNDRAGYRRRSLFMLGYRSHLVPMALQPAPKPSAKAEQ